MRFASSVEDIGRISAGKLMRAMTTGRDLVVRSSRSDLVYFTLSLDGPAFYRDCMYVAIVKARCQRLVVHIHGNAKTLRPAQRRLLQWAVTGATVIQLSPRVQLDADVLACANRVEFVPNVILDRARSFEGHERSKRLRILFLSNMLIEKGPLVLVEALGTLAAEGRAFEATFAGSPVAGTTALLNDAIAHHHLDDRVRCVGAVHGEDKQRLFATHDVFAFPTYYHREIFPLVLLEAMQWRLPAVATTQGAIADIVVDGETGYLVPPRDAAAVADRLRVLIEQPTTRATMAARARERYMALYTVERFEARLAAAFEHCLQHS
jgi:glycosyltransferase involved in cell wall biosynthesis